MNLSSTGFAKKSILLLLVINLLTGLLVFRDYGYSWDEPLFYDYADALGYAYSPAAWFSGDFDLERSFGSSGDDHKTRGPAYLLLGREPVDLLGSLGLDKASAWHLVNFLFFQLGVYFLYRLALRWMRPAAALAVAVLFSWQPLLWGHAFINPKDPPFLVFFLASVCLGFEMVDRFWDQTDGSRRRFSGIFLPAFVLGITTSIRVLGPLAGMLVVAYAILKLRKRLAAFIPQLLFYGIVALLAMFVTWPFLWENPATNFVSVFRLMSDNPTNLSVLFGGEVYRAGELPRRYLPFMIATTLTEPVLPLFVAGVLLAYFQLFKRSRRLATNFPDTDFSEGWRSLRSSLDASTVRTDLASLTLILLWFLILIAYVLLRRPAMYDGMRHFLFMLPPVFIFTGFTFDFLREHIAPSWLYAGLVALLVLPGILGIIRLHPYEYTYYNSFIGGTNGAFRRYETDFWLTCYKEAIDTLEQTADMPAKLYVHREAYIADYYAGESIAVHELRGAIGEVQSGDYVLVNTRTNEDQKVFEDAPPIMHIGRGDAAFCIIKQIP
ncbi:MAG TPA: hypothetical protein VGK56_21085 [Anaerolineales bacterium]